MAAIAPEAFVSIGAAGAPSFSKDGRTLFHLRGAGTPQVWALDLGAGASRQLTRHDEKVAFLRRSPADDRLIYGIDRGGDERQQLFLIDPAESHPIPVRLTDDPAVIHDFGAWSPDGARVAFAANDRDEAHFDVLLLDLADGERHRLLCGDGIVTATAFHPDGGRIAVLEDRATPDMSLLVVDAATGAVRRMQQPASTRDQSVRWTADGALLGLSDHGGDDFLRLCRLDLETGTATPLYAVPGRDVEAWSMSSDGALLATVENDRGYAVLRVGAPDLAERPVVDLPRGVVSELAFSPDGRALAFTVSAPTSPPALWRWTDGRAEPVWQPDVAGDSGIAPERLRDFALVDWETFDGVRIPGWLALPDGPGPHPAVIWVHGGPASQARGAFRPDMQMLLAQGLAVLMPNVRGSTGYGRASMESDDVGRRLDSVADLVAGRRWLAGHPAIDAARIGVMGQSYGGFMVLSAITEYQELFRAAIDYYGIADFSTLLAETGPWRRAHRAAEYGDPDKDAALFERISPIHRAGRVAAPLLVLHGKRDPRVPIGESERMVAALRALDRPVEYLTFDYAGHGFIRADDRRRAYAAVARFFAEHLR